MAVLGRPTAMGRGRRRHHDRSGLKKTAGGTAGSPAQRPCRPAARANRRHDRVL